MLPQISPLSSQPSLKTILLSCLASLVLLTGMSLTLIQPTSTVQAAPGINQTINFQGRLANPNGTVIADGSYSVVFSLYTQSSGGSNIWTETQSVSTTSGIFRVSLGS